MRIKSSKVIKCMVQTIWEPLQPAKIRVSDDGLFNIYYKDKIVSTWERNIVRVEYLYEDLL